ncbi:MAG: hypothetical protein EU536_02555 [Promethearchaeota archaeon]|nr:MAG: hypothetical protein EU536_02555 [Candidatus Lokiarchaeota archaeon]
MKVDGYELKGIGQRYRSETSAAISTYFGSYQNLILVKSSTVKLEHSYKGSIEISGDTAYYDQNYYLIKSESRWKIRLTGYYPEEFTVKYEYGNYEIQTNTPTVFEETYTIRFYVNGYLKETASCRDYAVYETQEMIVIEAGSFLCDRIKTNFYKNSVYLGYSRIWVDTNDGTLIKQESYDKNNHLTRSVLLLSKVKPVSSWEIAAWVLGALGIVIGGYAIYTKNKSRIPESGAKVDGKLRPNLHESDADNVNSKVSSGETFKVIDITDHSSKTIDEIITHPIQPEDTNVQPFKTMSEKVSLICPLCFGTGMITTVSGRLRCPLCKGMH